MCDTYSISKTLYADSVERETDKAVKLSVRYAHTGSNQNYDSTFTFWVPKSLLWDSDDRYLIPKSFIDEKIEDISSGKTFAFKHLKFHLSKFGKFGKVGNGIQHVKFV